ncbi:3-hydroxyacyl-ACP dehydratase FabZ [Reinekea marinisedimentorum]|uniref:3-hydroxyacyl-[acyl-carrier-protein] dehydratase FabZ n=1 Tax=Reinekea marinisedimentorum TaxID=230495 RepID=A0A4R3I901_9GAMM|nr:3-hydroxyacyl-ACP dehydratase FabZ [Reinekea marinisedimentorum]TCS40718.1 3-hydroxyacyl-[acyl-carrier-protein] dehydratase [Reinekea marinisedimentorum]
MSIELPLNIEQIKELLPHRYPFLLLDRVTEYTPGERIKGFKNVSANEAMFQGHFPDKAIFPGVLICEALAQLTAVYGFLTTGNRPEDGYLYLFAGLDNVKFKRQVVPGDRLELEIEFVSERRGMYKVTGQATVDGQLAASATIICAERKA